MKKQILSSNVTLIISIGFALASCTQPGTTSPQEPETFPTATQTTQAIVTNPPTETTESPTTTPDPLAVCPQPSGETALYINREQGYCLLYPLYFTAQIDPYRPGEILQLTGPRQEAGPKMQETAGVFMYISRNGPAEGMDSRNYAARWLALYAPGMPFEGPDLNIGGQPAVIVSDLPGFIPQQGAFIVMPHGRYTIFLTPQPGDIPELSEHASLVWETVTESIVFFEPQAESIYRRAEDVCPEASAEANLLIDQTAGYCLLYPADFELDPDIPGRVIGGPVLGSEQGFENIRTSLAVGTFSLLEGETLMDLIQQRKDTIDPDSILETTIAGYPAITFRGPLEPWAHRQAFIDADGWVYTIVAQPDEPERFAAGIPHLNRVWELAIDSISFFTPWR